MTATNVVSGEPGASANALRDAVRGVARTLRASLMSRAAVIGVGAGAAVWLVLSLAGRASIAWMSWPLQLAAALAVGIAVAWRVVARAGMLNDVRAALWIEEQQSVDFALVTAVESAPSLPPLWTSHVDGRAHRAIAFARAQAVRERWRTLRAPLAFAVIALVLAIFGWQPSTARIAVTFDAHGASSTSTRPAPIGTWRVRVSPPAYTQLPPRDLGDANTISALGGSTITIDGAGRQPDSVRVRTLGELSRDSMAGARTSVGATTLETSPDGWRANAVAPDGPGEVRVARDQFARLLLVDGVGDSIPRVTLTLPARDSVLRTARGTLNLSARLHDDLGLRKATFELVISSGEGERFTVKARQVGARALNNAHEATLSAAVDLGALQLGPGDVVHIRAIARDAHPLASHEAGTSETRSFRIARPSEYDSVAVEPAPPPEVDKSLLSQRMLLLLTQKLDSKRRSLAPAKYADEAHGLARDQARLREAVGDAVFQRLTGEGGGEHSHTADDGHDHGVEAIGGKLALSGVNAEGMLEEGDDSPVIAINKPLLEAYNAMWDAGRALEQSDTHAAIPFMRVALDAIERARAAQRLYLRGRPPTVIIDLNKVRMTGKDTGAVATREARDVLPPRAAQREARLLRAATLATRDASAARDSVAVLRLESLSHAPAFAEALQTLLNRLTSAAGADVTVDFVRARRALGGVARLPASSWTRGGPP